MPLSAFAEFHSSAIPRAFFLARLEVLSVQVSHFQMLSGVFATAILAATVTVGSVVFGHSLK